jgi:hypothetical protein
MTNFPCHMIPEAQNVCEAARVGAFVPPADEANVLNRNPSIDNLDAYLIAEQVGWICVSPCMGQSGCTVPRFVSGGLFLFI